MQQTLASAATFVGVGIHSGRPGCVRVLPAPAGFGIRFCLGDAEVPAVAESVRPGARCTLLGAASDVTVSTVEHLMAALYGLSVDNARIEVTGPEIPILDGSARLFVEAIQAAGLQVQEAAAPAIRLESPLWLQPGEPSQILALPAEGLTVTVAVDFKRSFLQPEVFSFTLDRSPGLEPRDRFARELAPARTFCFEDEVAAIRAAGLGGGGSIENTIVVSEAGTSTPLRFPNELARHKALDLLGDLALVGGRLNAHVIAVRAGHALHVAMAAAIRKAALSS
jgi:UDP-3-O-[3-hydroxymyristoyl] N-acetylglucosamine deacetylase